MVDHLVTGIGSVGLSAPDALQIFASEINLDVGVGNANPPNYYHVGLLRLGIRGYWFPPFPIDTDHQWVVCPTGCTDLAYSLRGTTTLLITEVAAPGVALDATGAQLQDANGNPIVTD